MNFSEAIELNLQDSKFEKTYEKKKKTHKENGFFKFRTFNKILIILI